MRLPIFAVSLLLAACGSTPITEEEFERRVSEKAMKKSEQLSRIDSHFACLDLDSMEFGNTDILSGDKLERIKQYEAEYYKTREHYEDLKENRIDAKKYLKHSKRLKGYSIDVFYDYISSSRGEYAEPKVLRGIYCNAALVDTDTDTFKVSLGKAMNPQSPDTDGFKSSLAFGLIEGLNSIVPDDRVGRAKYSQNVINQKINSKNICQCVSGIPQSSKATGEARLYNSDNLCSYVDSKEYQALLNNEMEVYRERHRLNEIGIKVVPPGNVIFKHNQMRNSNAEGYFKRVYHENAMTHYILELLPYEAYHQGAEEAIDAYACAMESSAKRKYNFLH